MLDCKTEISFGVEPSLVSHCLYFDSVFSMLITIALKLNFPGKG